MKFAIISTLLAFSLFSTTVIPLDEDQIVDSSDVIVSGSIINKDVEFGGLGKRIFTTYKVKVNDFLYPCDSEAGEGCINSASDDSFIYRLTEKEGSYRVLYVRSFGGVIGKIGMKVPGSPTFEVDSDKEFVFILKCSKVKDGKCENLTYSVNGFNQGLCKVTEKDSEKTLNCNYQEKVAKSSSTQGNISHQHANINFGKKTSMENFKKKLKEKSKIK